MPLAVAAVVNLTAVPMVPDQISCILVPSPALGCGVASNAPSQAFLPSPLVSGLSTTQMIPESASVPFEVTTGEPETNPKRKVLLAWSVRVGSSLPFTPTLNARR
jgi:hypothetical protein